MPRRGQAQVQHHPWRKRTAAQVEKLRVEGKLPPASPSAPKALRKAWMCPACGSESCAYGECVEGGF